LTTLDETVEDVDGLHAKLKRNGELDGKSANMANVYCRSQPCDQAAVRTVICSIGMQMYVWALYGVIHGWKD
jgi:hypothetical protein